MSKEYGTMTKEAFYQLNQMTDTFLIDVRESEEYAQLHVPNAMNYPLSLLEETSKELDETITYHVICQTGGRSAMASHFLAGLGLNVVNVEGGTVGYYEEQEKTRMDQ